MKGHSEKNRGRRGPKAAVGCEALEGRQLLTRGFGAGFGGLGVFGSGRGPFGMRAELGSFGGGRPRAMFGGGALGLGGGIRDPLYLLTAPLLQATSGSTTLPTRAALGSSPVQSAFQTLKTDFNSAVAVGAAPTHASIGQLENDLVSIRKGTLTGTAATTAIQTDEAGILTSMGLSTTQVAQIQSDIQNVATAIQTGSSTTTGATGSTPMSVTPTSIATPTSLPWMNSPPMGSTTTMPPTSPSTPSTTTPPTISAVQTAFQTLQTDLKNAVPVGAQPSYAAIGKVQDDLTAIARGTLTGSSALSTVQADTGAVLTSEGLTSSQVTQIQADQAALGVAIQAAQPSGTGGGSTGTSASPNSIAGVQATMQSVQPYLVGVPGMGVGRGGFGGDGFRGGADTGFGGGTMGGGGGIGGPMMTTGGGGIGGPMMMRGGGFGGSMMGGGGGVGGPMIPVDLTGSSNGPNLVAVASVPMIPATPVAPTSGSTTSTSTSTSTTTTA